MKISTPLLRIAREISPYLGSMARINLKEKRDPQSDSQLTWQLSCIPLTLKLGFGCRGHNKCNKAHIT